MFAKEYKEPKKALGLEGKHARQSSNLSWKLTSTFGLDSDLLPRSKGVLEVTGFSRIIVVKDLIAARPNLRKLEAARTLATWELCVLMDYTYTSPNISLQPLKHLDNPKHPFYGARTHLPERQLRKNQCCLTAVVAKMPSIEAVGCYYMDVFVAHYILGPDLRSKPERDRFTYSDSFQVTLLTQSEDSVESGDVAEAMRALRGIGRKRVQGKESMLSSAFIGVLLA